MKVSTALISVFLASTFVSCAHPWGGMKEDSTMGAHAGMKNSMMTTETQDKMAKMHSDAARCLRDGKSPEQCHDVMMKAHGQMCKEMGGEQCRDMGMMMGGR